MKSERRHELQHNDLAEWFIATYDRVMPYRAAIIGVTLLVIVIAVAWTIWRGRSEATAGEAWNTVGSPLMQLDGSRLERAATEYKGSAAGDWAQVLFADTNLLYAENQILEHKDAANQLLATAMDRYDKSLQSFPNPMARERAMFAQARILETVGKVPEAKAAYENLNKEFPKGAYKAIADSRLDELSRPETDEFYKALAQYNPKPNANKEKKGEKKEGAGPRSKLQNMTLPENPEEPAAPGPSPKGPATSSGTAAGPAKTTSAPVAPIVPPTTESPRPNAAKPLSTAAPAASSSAPAKK